MAVYITAEVLTAIDNSPSLPESYYILIMIGMKGLNMELIHLPLDKMAAISETVFSNAYS